MVADEDKKEDPNSNADGSNPTPQTPDQPPNSYTPDPSNPNINDNSVGGNVETQQQPPVPPERERPIYSDDQISQLIEVTLKRFDANDDGYIEYAEYKRYMDRSNKPNP